MKTSFGQSRRDFLVHTSAAGGALLLGFHLPSVFAAEPERRAAAEVNAWIVIHPDNSVVIRVARSELGQGSFTGLPMLVAEELECDWASVRAEYASPNENLRRNRIFGSMATGGSMSIRGSQSYLRKAGATAREMLIAAAARQWRVPAAECKAAMGFITHAASGRRVSFGSVAAKAAKLTPPAEVTLKDPRDWKLIGRPMKRFDIPDKVSGKTVFGSDIRLPGMLYAAIAQCPVFGGKVRSVDDAKVRSMRGVAQIVSLDGAVAVVADSWWRAQRALEALPVDWDPGEGKGATTASIREFVSSGLDDPKAAVARNEGDVEAAFSSAAKVIEAEYFAPFLAHATMEPMNCTAWLHEGRVEVWAPTQNGDASLAAAAKAAGVAPEQVEVHKMHVGGGFGRRSFQDYVTQAVSIAKAVGKPVQLLWSREEDMQHDFYRPMTMVRSKAAFDASGNLIAWKIRDSTHSIMARVNPKAIKNGVDLHALGGLHDSPYAVPNFRVELALRNSHVPVGFWRTVFHSQNPFIRECLVDEMAHAAGKDPYVFRRPLLGRSPRDLGVLDAVAKAANWSSPLAEGAHRGIAVADSHGSYSAAMIEVSVSDKGVLDIRRVVVALDCGYVVNPDSAVAQIQGCAAFALSAALWGEIEIKDGRAVQSNFDDYRVMRMAEMPRVEAVLAPSGGFWGGTGEPPLTCIAPALCNAIFAATGKRIRALPIKGVDLKRA